MVGRILVLKLLRNHSKHAALHITTSDVNKSHCLKEVQPTEEARMLLDESSGNLEFIARPTLDDDVYEIEVENIENVDDLTDKIIEECEMEILS